MSKKNEINGTAVLDTPGTDELGTGLQEGNMSIDALLNSPTDADVPEESNGENGEQTETETATGQKRGRNNESTAFDKIYNHSPEDLQKIREYVNESKILCRKCKAADGRFVVESDAAEILVCGNEKAHHTEPAPVEIQRFTFRCANPECNARPTQSVIHKLNIIYRANKPELLPTINVAELRYYNKLTSSPAATQKAKDKAKEKFSAMLENMVKMGLMPQEKANELLAAYVPVPESGATEGNSEGNSDSADETGDTNDAE